MLLIHEMGKGGRLVVRTSTGLEYRLTERDGALEVRVPERALLVAPKSSNVVELAVEPW